MSTASAPTGSFHLETCWRTPKLIQITFATVTLMRIIAWELACLIWHRVQWVSHGRFEHRENSKYSMVGKFQSGLVCASFITKKKKNGQFIVSSH